MPLEVYKVIHIIGIILIMSALGGAAVRAMLGAGEDRPTRKLLAMLHGIGAFLVLLGGFGMLARLGIMQSGGSFPAWLWVKLVIWGLLAAALVIPRRRPSLARPLLLSLPILGGLAAYMAIYKPF